MQFPLTTHTHKKALKVKLKNTLKSCKHKNVDVFPNHLMVICQKEYSHTDFCD